MKTKDKPRESYLITASNIVDGYVCVERDGQFVRVGRLPRGRRIEAVVELIITSRVIETFGHELHTRCSCCGEVGVLADKGLRFVDGKEYRNQPRCSPRSRRGCSLSIDRGSAYVSPGASDVA